MRVLQINTGCGFGSTGRTSVELAQALADGGHECHIAYGQGKSDYPNSYKIGGRLENHLHNAGSRLFGNQGYYSKAGTRGLIRYAESLCPDVVHLRNLHGNYLNLEILFRYLASRPTPVVWTLHDCWAFTGKCAHYTRVDCQKWQTRCHHCPQVRAYPPSLFWDRSARMYEDKKRWFTSISKMTVVAVSEWLAGEARKSFLAQYPVRCVYNWVDSATFKPAGGTRERFGLAAEDFVVLAVSAGWDQDDIKMMDLIALSRMLRGEAKIVLVGRLRGGGRVPEGFVHVPYTADTHELAQLYSMADVYAHLSVEDTFGKVIAEALACGTPAVVYNSTACPEVVGPGCGFVVEPRNLEQYRGAIMRVKRAGKGAFSPACVEFARMQYDLIRNARRYVSIYQELQEA